MDAAAAIAEKARQVAPGSFRHTVLSAAKRFKSSWAELGKLLVQVRDENRHEEWGYESFDAYCLKELHIRRQTAEKLLRSFSFLAKHEPREVTREDLVERAPAWEVVEVLADADARGQLSNEEYKAVRDTIWNAERPVAELRRELSERFPKPPPAAREQDHQLRRLAALARKLASELSAVKRVPRAIVERADALAADVEELVSSKEG